jgi:hypothetical protein
MTVALCALFGTRAANVQIYFCVMESGNLLIQNRLGLHVPIHGEIPLVVNQTAMTPAQTNAEAFSRPF